MSPLSRCKEVISSSPPENGIRDRNEISRNALDISKRSLICHACQLELQSQKTDFTYLGHTFYADMLRCPGCGQVFIPESLVKGRIQEVEMQMEDK